MPHCTFN